MKHFILSVTLSCLFIFAHTQCVTNVDFNTWSKAGDPTNGDWVVQGGGSSVRQTVNAPRPTSFISPFDLMNVRITGSFRTTDLDDDWMGFVFSVLNPIGPIDSFDCWIFDWKQENQGSSPRGMALNRVNGFVTNYAPFYDHQNTAEFTVIDNDFGGPGWVRFNNHTFELRLTYTRATIYVDGNLIFDHQDCYKPGRFGFYNLSQADCIYSNFQYDIFIDFFLDDDGKECLGDTTTFEFVSPCAQASLAQYQSLSWNFGDGTTLVNNNPTFANANAKHKYNAAGNYTATLTVTDFNGCSSTATKQVQVRNPITLTPTLTPPPCNGGTNGSVSVNPTGGFGPYQYNWSTGQTTQTAIGQGAGTYTVTVTDNICTTTGQYTLTQPTPLTATTSKTDANCNQANGTATIVLSGGTPPYTPVNWGGGFVGTTVTGLAPGTKIADFRDANGCSSLLQYSVNIGNLPCGISSSVSKVDVSCFGGNNGSATLTVTGGAANPQITWNPGGLTGATINNRPAGTYTYSYTDNVPGNAFTGQVVITQPTAPMVAQMTTIGITCAGANNGQAIASVPSGGVPPYNYAWSGGQPNNPVANNLAPGNITVTVTDSKGCTAVATGTISATPSLAVNIATTIDSCFNSGKGSAIATATGGTPPLSYSWSNFITTPDNLNLRAGTYTLTVTDNNNCTTSASATVTTPSALTQTYTKQNVDCFGGTTGSFNVTVSGGTPNYTFAWTPSTLSGTNPTNLPGGIYRYTITDAYNCTIFGGDTIFQPDSALTATTSHTDVTCNGLNNGTITVNTSGGTPPYTFLGNPLPAGSVTIPNLAPNTYAGNITDAKGCTFAVSETIAEPLVISLSEVHTDVSCNGGTNGSITLTVSGGTSPYTYNWGGGVTTQNRTNIPAGSYSVTVSDANNCTATIAVTITEPAAIAVSETHVDVDCNGNATGSIDVTANGGASALSFLWNDGTTTTEDRTAIPAGVYSVTVSDVNNCTRSLSITIAEPAVLTAPTSHTDVTCFGLNNGTITVTISGGTAPYTFLGNTLPAGATTIPNLAPNTYAGTLADANGCTVNLTETIAEPTALTGSETHTDATCFGAADGSITITVSGGTTPYNYNWGGGVTTQNRTNITAGSYTVTITDANSCTITVNATVNQPTAPPLAVATIDAACFGANGSATASPTEGTPPHTFTWSGSAATTATASLPAGTYTVTSTGTNGCQQVNSFTINQPAEIVIQETHVDADCNGAATGSITLSVAGGAGNYSYQWQPNVSTGNTATAINAGSYVITVTDQTSCTNTITVAVAEPAAINISATATNVSCFGLSDGSLTSVTTGGTPQYSFTATNGSGNFNSANGNFSALPAGSYTVVVTDANQCTASTTATITQPTEITLSAITTDVTCYLRTDGIITATASGGSPTYNYQVSTGSSNSSGLFSGLAAGNYTLTVTDNNNCTAITTAVVDQPGPVEVTVSPNPTSTPLGNPVQLNLTTNQSGTITYNWVPATGLNCSNCDNPVFEGINTVTYTVFVTTSNGCSGQSEITATVVPDYSVFVPNAFSPNNDGGNDWLQVYGNLKAIKQFELKVFNRWGEKVFETTDVNFRWDGYSSGKLIDAGVYVYAVKFVFIDNHTNNNYKGSLTVIR